MAISKSSTRARRLLSKSSSARQAHRSTGTSRKWTFTLVRGRGPRIRRHAAQRPDDAAQLRNSARCVLPAGVRLRRHPQKHVRVEKKFHRSKTASVSSSSGASTSSGTLFTARSIPSRRVRRPAGGASRATSSRRRVITISSPAATRSNRRENVVSGRRMAYRACGAGSATPRRRRQIRRSTRPPRKRRC